MNDEGQYLPDIGHPLSFIFHPSKMKLFLLTALLGATFPLFSQAPLNDITVRKVVSEKAILEHEMPQERDILWQKTIWRVIDVREKMNHPFTYPEAPFFDLLVQGVQSGELTAYDPARDDFSLPMSEEELSGKLFTRDTVPIWVSADSVRYEVVENSIFYEDIKRFRLKEIWYFDSKYGRLNVRILGIAPLQEVYGEFGDFRYEKPLFWVHYPTSREVLARETVFVESNEAARTTWEDFFEMRFFGSHITKEGNVRDNRLEDLYSGVDLLLEADKIKQEIFNYEHDLWSY